MAELVSVCMLAYNHGKWIDRAISSIIEQEVDFEFKLYIHDDASNDDTRSIVEKWAHNYPGKIYAVLQEENQYSKGVKIIPDIIIPHTEGKYIALCEGDDYWVDSQKLKKQVDYLEKHPDCTLSFSNAEIVDVNNKFLKIFLPQNIWKDSKINNKLKNDMGANFSVEEMILLDFIPTASLLIRREAYYGIYNFDFTLDLLIRLVATYKGYAHYHNECFVAYRTANPDSASGQVKYSKEKLKVSFYELHCKILRAFDEYSNYVVHSSIEHEINRKYLMYQIKTRNYKALIKNPLVKELEFTYVLKQYLNDHFGLCVKMIKNIIRKKKNRRG